jgi:riboflavin kinase
LSSSSSSNNNTTAPLPEDFYGAPLNLLVLGFIRPEYDYVSKESLIDDIRTDCDVAKSSLERGSYRGFEEPGSEPGNWLRDFRWVGRMGRMEQGEEGKAGAQDGGLEEEG